MKRMNDRTNETGAEALEKVHATPVFASTGWEPVEAEDPGSVSANARGDIDNRQDFWYSIVRKFASGGWKDYGSIC